MRLSVTTTRAGIIVLAAIVGAPSAFGAEPGFYVVGFYGEVTRDGVEQGPFDEFADAVYLGLAPGVTRLQEEAALGDDGDSGFGMAGGYRLLRNLAFEGGYMDLGEIDYRNQSAGTFEGEPVDLAVKLNSKTSGIFLSALGILPITYRWEAYVRAGVLFANNEIGWSITDFSVTIGDEFSDSSTEWLAGVGTSLSFWEVYGLRLEYQRVFGVSGFEGVGESDIDMLSVAISVTF